MTITAQDITPIFDINIYIKWMTELYPKEEDRQCSKALSLQCAKWVDANRSDITRLYTINATDMMEIGTTPAGFDEFCLTSYVIMKFNDQLMDAIHDEISDLTQAFPWMP